jgi:hypothetical protein
MFIVKLFKLDPSSYRVKGCRVRTFKTLEDSEKFLVKEHWKIAWDNCDTELELKEFLNQNTLESIKDELYDTFEYEIEEQAA